MAIYKLDFTQKVCATPEHCWDFFSNPRNLQRITPRSLGFDIRSELPARMYPGLLIEYRVRPLLGIPVTWLTEITHVEEGRYFVDEQRVGPYALWHHEHFFTALDDGTMEVRDLVHYRLPFSPLGDLAHPILVRPQLKRIFQHRVKAVEKIFVPSNPAGPRGSK